MKRFLTVFLSLSLIFGIAEAQKLYKWVDEDGNVTYQGDPPPGMEGDEYAEDLDLIQQEEQSSDPGFIAEQNYPVTLYSIPVCDACDLVRNILDKNGVPFAEKNASESIDAQDELRSIAGQLSVPVLTIGPAVVYGYSAPEIKEELLNAGYPVDGQPGRRSLQEEQTGLSPEEVAAEALRSAEELTRELDEFEEEPAFPDDLESAEEIPDDEAIKVQVGG